MAIYMVIDNNVVVNAIVAEASDIPAIVSQHQAVILQSDAGEGIGWTYNLDGSFTAPQA